MLESITACMLPGMLSVSALPLLCLVSASHHDQRGSGRSQRRLMALNAVPFFHPRRSLLCSTHLTSQGNTRLNCMASSKDLADVTTKILENGQEYVVSFEGRSQYGIGGGGVSACGLAALNCARVVLGKEKEGLKGVALLQTLMKRETLEVRYSFSHRSAVPTELTRVMLQGHPRDMPSVDERCAPRR